MKTILILGSGAFGSALASVLTHNNKKVYVYGIDKNQLQNLEKGKNPDFFGDLTMNPVDKTFADLTKALLYKPDYILFAVPEQALNPLAKQIAKELINKPIFINASKSFDYETRQPASVQMKKILKNKYSGWVDLYGPSFAIDIFQKETTFVNVVSKDKESANKVAKLFNNEYFVCTYELEEETVAFASTFKNVIAIACGITSQLTNSINTQSAILAQAIKELSRIVKLKNYKRTTLFNFSGIGDVFLTSSSKKSRNFRFGQQIVKVGVKKALENNTTTIGGYRALKVMREIVSELKLERCPVICALYDIVYKNKDPKNFIKEVRNKTFQQQNYFWKE